MIIKTFSQSVSQSVRRYRLRLSVGLYRQSRIGEVEVHWRCKRNKSGKTKENWRVAHLLLRRLSLGFVLLGCGNGIKQWWVAGDKVTQWQCGLQGARLASLESREMRTLSAKLPGTSSRPRSGAVPFLLITRSARRQTRTCAWILSFIILFRCSASSRCRILSHYDYIVAAAFLRRSENKQCDHQCHKTIIYKPSVLIRGFVVSGIIWKFPSFVLFTFMKKHDFLYWSLH